MALARGSNLSTLNEMWARDYGKYDERGWDADGVRDGRARTRASTRWCCTRAAGSCRSRRGASTRCSPPRSCAAYNDWAAKFVAAAPDRLLAVGQLDLRDVDRAVAEARRVRSSSTGSRRSSCCPNRRSPASPWSAPYYEPLWSALEELDVALALHNVAGTGLGQIGADRFGQWALPRVAAAFPLESQLTLFSFLVGGICDRHPGLRVVVLESGAGWLPFWLWWLDELYERYEGLDCDSLSMPPSDLFRRQCFISAEMEEPTVRAVVDALGAGCIVTASDFPHPEGTFPNGVREFAERDDLTDATKRAILSDNPKRLYGL